MATKISGGGYTITTAKVEASEGVFDLVPNENTRLITNDSMYVELDLTEQSNVVINLPAISTLGGLLNLQIWISDVAGSVDGEFTLQLNAAAGDTIGGQDAVVLIAKFSGMMVTPLSGSQWGTFYTSNFAAKAAELPAEDEILAFKKVL